MWHAMKRQTVCISAGNHCKATANNTAQCPVRAYERSHSGKACFKGTVLTNVFAFFQRVRCKDLTSIVTGKASNTHPVPHFWYRLLIGFLCADLLETHKIPKQ